jgi:molybdopterin/thiamine biosynthesis adenylyltransferase
VLSWFDFLPLRAERQGPWQIISFLEIREAAEDEGLSPIEAEIRCLQRGYVPSRYIRNMGTIGIDGQIRLLRSSVAVIGCGGLGGLVADLLARAGVGRLVLVDGDVFDETNLNRQILSTEGNLGLSKSKVAAQRVYEINGALEPEARQCMFDEYTAPGILEGCDLAVDCLDSLTTRRVLFTECRTRGIPVVSGAIGGFWGQVGIAMPDDQNLAEFLSGDTDKGVETETGNPPFTPAVVAALECAQAVKILTGKGKVLRDQLLWMDLAEDEFTRLRLS